MKEVLVPISDAGVSRWAADQAIALYRREPAHIHLLNVQRPLPRHVSQFFSGADIRAFHNDVGMKVLQSAIEMLDEAGVPHDDHVLVGKQAETIVNFARDHHCNQVILDSNPRTLGSLFGLGSISSQVRHLMQMDPADQMPSHAPGSG